jgi:hypothetical protein
VAKSTAMANNFLKLLFQAVAWANVADNAASAPLTNLYVSLLTADPGTTGDQTTNETTYTSYARQAVARTSGGWAVTNNVASPVANIVFPASTGGTPTITHFGIGSSVSGAGNRFYSGTVTPNIVVSTSVVQTLTTGSTITET